MKINDIINEGRGGGSASANQSSSFVQDIGDFAGRVKQDVAHTGKFLGDVGKSAIDPETYKQAGRDIQQGWEQAKKDPKQAAINAAQTADDAMRSAANAMTFGGADYVASKLGGTDVEAEKAKSQAAWERSPKASMAGAVGGSLADIGFLAGTKAAGKLLGRTLPKATTTPGKIATGTGSIAGQTAAGFTGSRAGWDVADKLKNSSVAVPENKKLNELGPIRGPKAPHVSAPHNVGIAGLDPNVKKAQAQASEPTNASYQERARAAQQRADAAKASDTAKATGTVDTKQTGNLEKPSLGTRIKNKAIDLGVTGALGYGAYQGAKKYAFSPSKDSPYASPEGSEEFDKKWEALKSKQDTQDTKAQATINTSNVPQTNRETGSMFDKDLYKTNESVSELARLKYLTGYRK